MTANRLVDGAVVYLTPDDGWSGRVGDCLVVFDEDGDGNGNEAGIDRMKLAAQAAERDRLVIGAYVFDVAVKGGVAHPARLREAIRAHGPTVGRSGARLPNGNGTSVPVR